MARVQTRVKRPEKAWKGYTARGLQIPTLITLVTLAFESAHGRAPPEQNDWLSPRSLSWTNEPTSTVGRQMLYTHARPIKPISCLRKMYWPTLYANFTPASGKIRLPTRPPKARIITLVKQSFSKVIAIHYQPTWVLSLGCAGSSQSREALLRGSESESRSIVFCELRW